MDKQRRPKQEHYEYGKPKKVGEPEEPVIEKEKPNLGLSGALCKDTNTFNGVVIKYNEPGEARKPKKRWRLYIFKDDKELPFLPMHRQSAYLIGKDRRVADIPVDHPSCSKQHAVFQYRVVEYERKDRSTGRIVKPYVIDLESTNGTFVNNSKIESQRYYELREKDVLKFGFSSREYVLLHEESKDDFKESEDEEDIKEREPIIEPSKIKTEKPSRPASPKKLSPLPKMSKSKHKTGYDSESSSGGSDSDDNRRSIKKFRSSRK